MTDELESEYRAGEGSHACAEQPTLKPERSGSRPEERSSLSPLPSVHVIRIDMTRQALSDYLISG
jgi:hypothetical protein